MNTKNDNADANYTMISVLIYDDDGAEITMNVDAAMWSRCYVFAHITMERSQQLLLSIDGVRFGLASSRTVLDLMRVPYPHTTAERVTMPIRINATMFTIEQICIVAWLDKYTIPASRTKAMSRYMSYVNSLVLRSYNMYNIIADSPLNFTLAGYARDRLRHSLNPWRLVNEPFDTYVLRTMPKLLKVPHSSGMESHGQIVRILNEEGVTRPDDEYFEVLARGIYVVLR